MSEHFAIYEQAEYLCLSLQRQTKLLQLESNHIDLKYRLSRE